MNSVETSQEFISTLRGEKVSKTKNGGERCDVCGKLTRSKDGYYLKPDGVNAGYMHSQEWYGLKAVDDGSDICEECAEKKERK